MLERFVLDEAGVGELLKSAEMSAMLAEVAEERAAALGDGYAVKTAQISTRAKASIYTETAEAYQDTLNNNTLLQAIS